MKEIPVTIVANSLIDDVWYQVAPLLLKGKKYWDDYFSLEDIKRECIEGRMQLWVGVNGEITMCALTTIDVYPRGKFLRIVYIGGRNWRAVAHSHEQIKQFALKHSCVGTDTIARDGWMRLLAYLGYKKRAIYLVNRFDEE